MKIYSFVGREQGKVVSMQSKKLCDLVSKFQTIVLSKITRAVWWGTISLSILNN